MDVKTLFDVTGKTALVTGGSAGIGLMMSRALIRSGAKVYITARSADVCRKSAEELNREGPGQCVALPGDLSTYAGIRAVADTLMAAEPRLSILVNNAGVMEQAAFPDFTEAMWDRAFDLNVKAAYFLTQSLLPALLAAATAEDPARVVNVTSGQGIKPSRFNNAPYQATKAALNFLTRVLAQELADDNITVNAIAPGVFRTNITSHFDDATWDAVGSGIPRHREGSPEDAGGALLYLTSRAGAYLTSAIIPVDGGWSG